MKNIKLFILFFFTSITLIAQTPYEILSGETLVVETFSAVQMPDGILIHDGGELILEPQSLLLIGVGAEIRVRDGGKISGTGGHIEALQINQTWNGIVVEPGAPNNNLAINLYNTTIADSNEIGVEILAGETGSRRVYFNGVRFLANQFADVIFEESNLSIPNGSQFINCDFLELQQAWWNVQAIGLNDVTFDGCYFDGSASIALHFDGSRNVKVENCVFYYRFEAITFHFINDKVQISNNTFYSISENSLGTALAIGSTTHSSGPFSDFSIFENEFFPLQSSDGTAIRAGIGSSPLTDFSINRNTIYGYGNGFKYGIRIADASGGINNINANGIYGAQYGIFTEGNNSALRIFCNGLDRNFYHIYNTGDLSNQHPLGIDPNNKFYDTPEGGYDIYNQSKSSFLYFVYGGSQTDLTPNINFNVNIFPTFHINRCRIDVEDEPIGDPDFANLKSDSEKDVVLEPAIRPTLFDKLNLFPNPASASITVEGEKTFSAIQVYSSTGLLVKMYAEVNSKKLNINLTDYFNGVYLCKIIYENGSSSTSTFIVKK